MNHPNAHLLISCKHLKEHLEDDDLVIIDCHWDMNAYLRGHIPGAIARPGHPYVKGASEGEASRYLPDEEGYVAMMAALGITNDKQVVLYDEWDNHFATRLWWVMDFYGHPNVQLLNGGWQAWVTQGGPISLTPHEATPAIPAIVPRPNPRRQATMDEIMQHLSDESWQVLDVRSDSEYDGSDVQNARGGHIPGALHLEWKRMLQPSDLPPTREFGSVAHMTQLLEAAGVDRNKTIVSHCQSGIRGSFMVFCLVLLGYEKVKLYDASMAEWANREETPLVS